MFGGDAAVWHEEDEESISKILQFGPCRFRGLRRNYGLPLAAAERPDPASFRRVMWCDREALRRALDREWDSVPFHPEKVGGLRLVFRIVAMARIGPKQEWLLWHRRYPNILVQEVMSMVFTLTASRNPEDENSATVTLTTMSGEFRLQIEAGLRTKLRHVRHRLLASMPELSRLDKEAVRFASPSGQILKLRSSHGSRLLKTLVTDSR